MSRSWLLLQGVETPALLDPLTPEGLGPILKAAAIVVLGIPLIFLLSRGARRAATERLSAQRGLLAGKLVLYPGLLILAISVMNELGFSLAPLLGAAGIVGVALGFASQTSVSNVISGFFLMGEQPFVVGDVIQVGDTTGEVLSIDTLSVKLRTFDNKFVRIPNESLIKAQVTTITRFPIRRLDLSVGLAYKEDPDRVTELLLDCADRNPRALMEPEPRVFFDGFGESSVDLRLAVWAAREDFLALKYELQAEIKRRFDAEGVEIPFPHRTLYAGAATEAFPVRIVAEGETEPPSDVSASDEHGSPAAGIDAH